MSFAPHLQLQYPAPLTMSEQTVNAFVLGAQPDVCLLAINPDGEVAVALDTDKFVALSRPRPVSTPGVEPQQRQGGTGMQPPHCYRFAATHATPKKR